MHEMTGSGERLLGHMARLEIDLVLDVGANVGQYAGWLRSEGFGGKIISFEPLSAAFAKLRLKCEEDDKWSCYQLAIGDKSSQASINVSANSWSSSLLPLYPQTVQLEPSIAYVGRETVAMRRLDELVPRLTDSKGIFLKVDTQGFERRVIRGASAIIDRLAMLQLELPLKLYYKGQAGLAEMIDLMSGLNFEAVQIEPAWVDKAHIIREIDVVFARSGNK